MVTAFTPTPCVAFVSHVDPGTTIVILAQGPSCIIGNAVLILQPLEKESSRAPYRNNPQIAGPGTSILSSSTIGILDSLAEQIQGPPHTFSTTTRYLFPSGIRFPPQWVSVCGSGAGFLQRSIHNVIRWRRLHGSLFRPIQVLADHPATLKRRSTYR